MLKSISCFYLSLLPPPILQDKEAKPRPLSQRYGGSKAGGGTLSSSRAKEASCAYHYTFRHRNGNNLTDTNGGGSSGGKSFGKTGSKITSSNRFEKLDPDIDCEASNMSMSTNEGDSPPHLTPSPSVSSSSGSSSSLKIAEEKRGGKERIARGGRGIFRKGVSGRQQQQVQGSGEAQVGGSTQLSSASHTTEELVPEDFRGDGSRKKLSRHIKFDVPTDTDSSHPMNDSSFSASSTMSFSSRDDLSAELHRGEGSADHGRIGSGGMVSNEGGDKVDEERASSGETAPSANIQQQADKPKRIIYERVSCELHVLVEMQYFGLRYYPSFTSLIPYGSIWD